MGKGEPRIILFDIESMPDLPAVMRNFAGLSDYPGLTLKASINSIVCFGYKVYGEAKTHCLNAWDYDSWGKDVNDDRELLIAIKQVLETADCIVTHNGKRFDLKFIQTRLLKHGLSPLPKILHVDTCQESKKHLLMYNNRLNTLAKFLTAEEKLENGGWDLWVKVHQRDKKAMDLMSKYCKQDVNVLNEVFKKLKPFITSIPNYNMFKEHDKSCCPNCGSTRLQGNGKRVTKTRIVNRVLCADCGTSMSLTYEGDDPRTI